MYVLERISHFKGVLSIKRIINFKIIKNEYRIYNQNRFRSSYTENY